MANEDRIQELLDVEEIKQLKARYFRFLDTKEYGKLPALFTEEAELSFDDDTVFFGGKPGGTLTPAIAVAWWRKFLGPGKTVHHGHMPEIEITGENNARGIWAMIDYVEFRPGPPRQGIEAYGHYHEEYVREGGAWKIAKMRLTRLRIDGLPRDLDPPHWDS